MGLDQIIGKIATLSEDFVDAFRGEKIVIPYGRHTYGPRPRVVGSLPWVKRLCEGSRIGNYCSIASGVRFLFLGKHNLEWISTYPFQAFYDQWHTDAEEFHHGIPDTTIIDPAPIIVGNDVWIASNASVKEGVTVGDGAVIAMESLVTKDVPPYAIVGGNPARIIRYRFSPEIIDELISIAWWNWEDRDVEKIVPYLLSNKVETFIEKAKYIQKERH